MRLATASLCLALGACAHHPVDPPADKPVAVSCVDPATPAAPKVHTREQLRQVPDGPTRYVMAAADYQAMLAWVMQAGPVIEGCRRAADP
jgi:hypothetical protein